METWNKLIAIGGKESGEEWRKKGEGISQRTCRNESWAWTTKRRLTVGERGGLGGGAKWKKMR